MKTFKEWKLGPNRNQRRFRVTIYVDVWVPLTDDKEKDREIALIRAQKIADFIDNKTAYVGGIKTYQDEIVSGKDI